MNSYHCVYAQIAHFPPLLIIFSEIFNCLVPKVYFNLKHLCWHSSCNIETNPSYFPETSWFQILTMHFSSFFSTCCIAYTGDTVYSIIVLHWENLTPLQCLLNLSGRKKVYILHEMQRFSSWPQKSFLAVAKNSSYSPRFFSDSPL